jgi:hypothetical protein
MISEYTVPWVTVENPDARDLAIQWIKSKKEHVVSSGWCTYAGLVATRADEALDLAEIEGLLSIVVKGIDGAQNRVRYTMNGFVIAAGTYVKPLLKQAKASARQIGAVSVDMGDTACNIPLATAYIEKIEGLVVWVKNEGRSDASRRHNGRGYQYSHFSDKRVRTFD